MIWVLQIWFIIYLWSKPHSLFTYLSSPQWHYQERRMETDTETNLYSTASLLIHFLKFCFILYTISDKVVYLLCALCVSVSVHVFCRIRTIRKFWGKWLNRFLHKYEYAYGLTCTDWWEATGQRLVWRLKMEDVTSDCEERTGTVVLKPLLWSRVGNFYWKPDSYFEKWRLLSHNNNCKVQYWWGWGLV